MAKQKWNRIAGRDRDILQRKVAHLYVTRTMSIREVSAEVGRSYGSVHRLLHEAGVELRPRGQRR